MKNNDFVTIRFGGRDFGKTKALQLKLVKEFADKIHTEIHKALESNYKARNERVDLCFKKDTLIGDDSFVQYCEGKIAALRGIDDFIDELLKKWGGE